jgi:uncharacterized protein YgiM (DUF1202 family)
MRAVLLYLATITIVIWMASDGRVDRDHLPIINSRAPTHISNLPLPDPHDLNNLSVVPAAQAGGAYFEEVYVQGSLVNVRSGPGLSYRMIDVLECGECAPVLSGGYARSIVISCYDHNRDLDGKRWPC